MTEWLILEALLGLAAVAMGRILPKPSKPREKVEVGCLLTIIGCAAVLGSGAANQKEWVVMGSLAVGLAAISGLAWLIRIRPGGPGGGDDAAPEPPKGPIDWEAFDQARKTWQPKETVKQKTLV